MSLVDDPKFAQLRISGRLPAPKGIALQVIQLTQQPDASNQSIARLIGADPVFSARVLKAANVLFHDSPRPVATIADAVMVLGARGLRQLVLGISLIADYGNGPCKQFDYLNYWSHSLLTGIAAKHLTQYARLAASDEIFVVGLLGNIGQLALATAFSDEFGELLTHQGSKSVAELHKLERAKFGFDESELSEAMLAEMHFPAIFQRMARHYKQPDISNVIEATREWRLLHVLHAASLLSDILLAAPSLRQDLILRLKLQAMRVVIDLETLCEIGDACVRDWQEWSTMLNFGNKLNIKYFSELLQTTEDQSGGRLSPQGTGMADSYPLRVMVVEDDPETLKLLEAVLQEAGHNVKSARNGVEAMRMIKKHPPQLLITGRLMPEMDGMTLCSTLRLGGDSGNIQIIMLTDDEGSDSLVELFDAGVNDYLVKPVTPKILFARLRAAQRVIRLQDELAFDRQRLQHFSNELLVANQRLQQMELNYVASGLPTRRDAIERQM